MAAVLPGRVVTADQATNTAERILARRGRHRSLVMGRGQRANGLNLLAELYRRPLVNVDYVAEILGVTFPTANRLVAGFEELGLLREVTGQHRGRRYRFGAYLRLFDDEPTNDRHGPAQLTDTRDETAPVRYPPRLH
jgi:hypothetical protein